MGNTECETVHELKSVFSHISPIDESVKVEANNGNILLSPLTFSLQIMTILQYVQNLRSHIYMAYVLFILSLESLYVCSIFLEVLSTPHSVQESTLW